MDKLLLSPHENFVFQFEEEEEKVVGSIQNRKNSAQTPQGRAGNTLSPGRCVLWFFWGYLK